MTSAEISNSPGRSRLVRRIQVGLALLLFVVGAALFAIVSASSRERTSGLSLGTEIRNFREVDAGKFYRSGQLSGKQFEDAINVLGIRTIVNLRGAASSETDWYREEIEVTTRLGVDHVDVRLSARSVPRKDQLILLLDTYRDAERPILVHCQDGADRAGEAAAIYAAEYMGKSREEALEMLSVRFFHVEMLRPAKRYFAERYQGEEWARTAYDPCEMEYFDVSKYCRHRRGRRAR